VAADHISQRQKLVAAKSTGSPNMGYLECKITVGSGESQFSLILQMMGSFCFSFFVLYFNHYNNFFYRYY